jgi:hypothetical protein
MHHTSNFNQRLSSVCLKPRSRFTLSSVFVIGMFIRVDLVGILGNNVDHYCYTCYCTLMTIITFIKIVHSTSILPS